LTPQTGLVFLCREEIVMVAFRVTLFGCVLAVAAGAQITDAYGVILIDQQHALVGGIGPGDASGFPVTITTPGSYKLITNLTVNNLNTSAIEIRANHVTLDLNGFSIIGPNVCPPPDSGTHCPIGGGRGIDGIAGPDVTVKNGSVTGVGLAGIELFAGGVVRNVTVSHSGGPGIVVNIGGSIMDSFATHNGDAGVLCFDGLVSRTVSGYNGFYGITGNCGYAENIFVGNAAGSVFGSGVNLGQNKCNAVLCP
jgi:hypothetical protein